jgi:hypothetical protein
LALMDLGEFGTACNGFLRFFPYFYKPNAPPPPPQHFPTGVEVGSDSNPPLPPPPPILPPLSSEESHGRNLPSLPSHFERTREPPTHSCQLQLADRRGGGRTGINRYCSTHSAWPGPPCGGAHDNVLPSPIRQATEHTPMLCPAPSTM